MVAQDQPCSRLLRHFARQSGLKADWAVFFGVKLFQKSFEKGTSFTGSLLRHFVISGGPKVALLTRARLVTFSKLKSGPVKGFEAQIALQGHFLITTFVVEK